MSQPTPNEANPTPEPPKPVEKPPAKAELVLKGTPWEIQDGEPVQWFNRFLVYKDLGSQRILKTACEKIMGKAVKSVGGNWTKMARTWKWSERALAFDKNQREKISKEIASHRERASAAQEKAIADLSEIIAKMTDASIPVDKRMELLKENGPILLALCGKGGGANFLLNGYKTLFGEKHVVEDKARVLIFKD